MTIMPRFKPGQLVSLSYSNLDMVGLVKSVSPAPRHGAPAYVLVEWSADHDIRQREEYIPQSYLKLVEDV